ncbi:MAG TPA: hypothetical protein VFI87_06390 [Hyphomicrobiaceae bacterium]|nr:hypothetical protein [Hyphomicrobiaceae bacterium]
MEGQISADQLAMMMDSGANIVAASSQDDETFDIAVLEPQPPRFVDYVVPNEECSFAYDARDLDEFCVYVNYRTLKTVSDIAQMGYDVTNLADENYYDSRSELAYQRDTPGRTGWFSSNDRDGPNRTVWLLEEYAKYDLDGDGITELLKVHRVGAHILHVEPMDEQPGVSWSPFPMPHRITGQSLADKVMDIQRTSSVLKRQYLDNLYQTNAPRMLVSEGSIGDTTLDDLLTIRAGGIVRYVGGVAPTPITLPFAAQHALEAMDNLAGEKEQRTGITRLNQGLDADTLNKTATGQAMLQASGQQIEEYVTRNFAEGFARLMLKKYRLMRKYGRPMTLMIDGEQVQVDPRQWPDDMNVVVRVGLGTGRKEQRIASRLTILEIAKELVMSGSRLIDDEKLYNMVKGVIADSNIGNVRDYINDPAQLEPAEEKPDPAAQKAQADAVIAAQKAEAERAIKTAELQMKSEQSQVDAQLRQQETVAKIELMREEASAKLELEAARATAEAEMNQRRMDFEQAMAVRQMEFNERLALRQADTDAEVKLSKNREGGDLDK